MMGVENFTSEPRVWINMHGSLAGEGLSGHVISSLLMREAGALHCTASCSHPLEQGCLCVRSSQAIPTWTSERLSPLPAPMPDPACTVLNQVCHSLICRMGGRWHLMAPDGPIALPSQGVSRCTGVVRYGYMDDPDTGNIAGLAQAVLARSGVE